MLTPFGGSGSKIELGQGVWSCSTDTHQNLQLLAPPSVSCSVLCTCQKAWCSRSTGHFQQQTHCAVCGSATQGRGRHGEHWSEFLPVLKEPESSCNLLQGWCGQVAAAQTTTTYGFSKTKAHQSPHCTVHPLLHSLFLQTPTSQQIKNEKGR